MSNLIIKKKIFKSLGDYFYRIARYFWSITTVCNYCGKDVGFNSVVSSYGFTCWKCKERLDYFNGRIN